MQIVNQSASVVS